MCWHLSPSFTLAFSALSSYWGPARSIALCLARPLSRNVRKRSFRPRFAECDSMRRRPCIFSWDPNWPLLRLSINRARGWPLSLAILEFRNHAQGLLANLDFAEHVSCTPLAKVGGPSQCPHLSSRVVQMPSFHEPGGWMVMLPYLSLFWQLLPQRCWATAPCADMTRRPA